VRPSDGDLVYRRCDVGHAFGSVLRDSLADGAAGMKAMEHFGGAFARKVV